MKIAVFVDYWNLQIALNHILSKKHGVTGYKAKIDWQKLGVILAKTSCSVLSCSTDTLSYEGCYIYTSYNPSTDDGKTFKRWATNWLDRQPGNNVEIRERRPRSLPKCPTCHQEITHCPHTGCGEAIVGTIEKGVDTLLVTDLIRLAFSDTYDAAVLASSDADMVPAVKFVQTIGKKVVQAGFPATGMDLGKESWGSFLITDVLEEVLRDNRSG